MIYTIQNGGYYYWTGRNRDQEQVIVGLLAPHILLYSFDQVGSYIKRELVQLSKLPKRDRDSSIYLLDSQFMARFSGELNEVQHRIGYQPGSISVKEFFDPDYYVGVSPYPSEYQEFLDFPDRFSEEEKHAYESHIRRWNEDGQFVFCWAEEYWMNRDGEAVSS
jgi:hypothetical protein